MPYHSPTLRHIDDKKFYKASGGLWLAATQLPVSGTVNPTVTRPSECLCLVGTT
jgi:hypothetical protein